MERIEFFDRHAAAELAGLLSVELDAVRAFVFGNVSRDRGARAALEAVGAVAVLFVLSWRLGPVLAGVIVVRRAGASGLAPRGRPLCSWPHEARGATGLLAHARGEATASCDHALDTGRKTSALRASGLAQLMCMGQGRGRAGGLARRRARRRPPRPRRCTSGRPKRWSAAMRPRSAPWSASPARHSPRSPPCGAAAPTLTSIQRSAPWLGSPARRSP